MDRIMKFVLASLFVSTLAVSEQKLVLPAGSIASGDGRPPFSWETLPVFFHSANHSGQWSDAAAKQIARFAMVTFEKDHGMGLPGSGRESEELAGPRACRQISAEKRGTQTFFYLNSLIDWPTNYALHALMKQNPTWRLKNRSGGDLLLHGQYLYNLTNDDMRTAWVAECVTAAAAGCTGCFVDQANVDMFLATWPHGSAVATAYRLAHLEALTKLDAMLAPSGKYAIYNHLGVTRYGTTATMIEDFAASEKCVRTLQTAAARGLTVQAHAGNLPAGNACRRGDTNTMAAFLVAAGEYSYYHCSTSWASNAAWPSVRDSWLDWLPEYDLPLGPPLGPAARRPSPTSADASLWSRSFGSGTRVEFDGGRGNGTIHWAHGPVQVGPPADLAAVANGCRWESMLRRL